MFSDELGQQSVITHLLFYPFLARITFFLTLTVMNRAGNAKVLMITVICCSQNSHFYPVLLLKSGQQRVVN